MCTHVDEWSPYSSSVKTVLFVPYALHDRDAYAATARKAYTEMGIVYIDLLFKLLPFVYIVLFSYVWHLYEA